MFGPPETQDPAQAPAHAHAQAPAQAHDQAHAQAPARAQDQARSVYTRNLYDMHCFIYMNTPCKISGCQAMWNIFAVYTKPIE